MPIKERDPIIGCGSCSLCCTLMTVESLDKPSNTPCQFCKPGTQGGCCTIHDSNPDICKNFQCIWLQSQKPRFPLRMPRSLKPSESHVVLCWSHSLEVVFAFTDPQYPWAFKKGAMGTHLSRLISEYTIIAIVGSRVFLLQPDLRVQELKDQGQVQDQEQEITLPNGLRLRLNGPGRFLVGVPNESGAKAEPEIDYSEPYQA